jgi:hypothetical protein
LLSVWSSVLRILRLTYFHFLQVKQRHNNIQNIYQWNLTKPEELNTKFTHVELTVWYCRNAELRFLQQTKLNLPDVTSGVPTYIYVEWWCTLLKLWIVFIKNTKYIQMAARGCSFAWGNAQGLVFNSRLCHGNFWLT